MKIKMKSFTKIIIIKIICIWLSAFIIATSSFLYFNTEYSNHILIAILFIIGIMIFVLSMKYEIKLEMIEG